MFVSMGDVVTADVVGVQVLVEAGAFMEEKQGWERPGYFVTDGNRLPTLPYDFYGSYGHAKHENYAYADKLEGDCKYEISDHNAIVRRTANWC